MRLPVPAFVLVGETADTARLLVGILDWTLAQSPIKLTSSFPSCRKMGFPSTQEVNEQNAQADKMHEKREEERRREAE
jgi:hypothetical protein